jgi:hypothetical protein
LEKIGTVHIHTGNELLEHVASPLDVTYLTAVYILTLNVLSPFKGTVSRDFRLLVFFMNQFPQASEYRAVSNFSKIRGDIRSSRCTTGVVDTDGKFAAGVVDTDGKFAAGVVDTDGAPGLANF